MYAELARRIRLERIGPQEIAAVLRAKAPTDEQFEREFATRSVTPTAGSTRYLLRVLESGLAPFEVSGETRVPDKCHVEHILPQEPSTEWLAMLEADGQVHREWVNRLGNLTFLERRLNLMNGNRAFVGVKRDNFARSIYRMANVLAGEDYPTWTTGAIARRQAELASKAVGLWRIV